MKHPHLFALLLTATAVSAHVTLDQPAAQAGSSYRATFKIGHGCDGAPTKVVIVTLPEGLRGAKPMPKPGWTLTSTRRPLIAPYDSHGKRVIDELAEVRWTANDEASQLQDDWYDEFVLRATLPAESGALAFAVRQVCTRGDLNWTVPLKMLPAGTSAQAH